MTGPSRASLSIGELAHRTGVPTTTLRSWERRYGFPEPLRHDGGHRRYAESDVDAVLEVLARRRAGLSLTAAVQRAGGPAVRTESVFAELRRRHPALVPQALARSTLVAMSHAVEDECCARAASPLLFGAFQRERFLARSRDRWRELARTSRRAVVFADFAAPAEVREGLPVEVAVPADSPLLREWLVVCDAEDLPACLVAVERPGGGAGTAPERQFEAVWSVDPQVVRDASDVAAALADAYRPDWRADARIEAGYVPAPASEDLQRAQLLFDRMIGYVDRAAHPRSA